MWLKMRYISRSSNKLHRLFHSYSNQPFVANNVTGLNLKDIGPTSVNIHIHIPRHHLYNPHLYLTIEYRRR